jgi:hypothetical protein
LICEVAIGPVSNSLLKDGSSQSDYKTLLILDSVVSSINIVIFKIKGLANVVNNPSSPAFGDVIIRFGSSTDVQWSTTRSCVSLVVTPLTTSNALVPQSMIQCTLPSGVEQSLAFSVWIYDISLVPVLAPYGFLSTSGDQFDYPSPSILSSTLRQYGSTSFTSDLTASSIDQSEVLAFSGTNFLIGSVSLRVTIVSHI